MEEEAKRRADFMRSMLEELRFNLKTGLFVNLILIVQFAVFFWQGTIISSYFLEMPAGPGGGFDSASGDYDYYSVDGINFINEDEEAFFRNEAADPDFGANLAKAFSEIYGNPDLNFMAFGYGGMSVQIYCDSLPDTFDSQEQQVLLSERFNSPAMDGREVCEFMNLYQFDYPAETHFNFQVSEGQLLTEKDFAHSWEEEIPILLGHDFAGCLEAGDSLDNYLLGYQCRFRVAGILEEGTSVLTDQMISGVDEDGYGTPLILDNAALIPYLEMTDAPRTEDEAYFLRANYEGIRQDGILTVDRDTPRSEVSEMEKELCEIFTKNGIYPVTVSGSTYGVRVFKTESRETMRILLGASTLMGALSISGICMSVIAKLNRNLHRYGIELMNGQSPGPIMGAFLTEIFFVIAAAMAFNIWKYTDLMRWNLMFLWVILGMAFLSVLIVAAVFTWKLRKIDIEEIIRNGE